MRGAAAVVFSLVSSQALAFDGEVNKRLTWIAELYAYRDLCGDRAPWPDKALDVYRSYARTHGSVANVDAIAVPRAKGIVGDVTRRDDVTGYCRSIRSSYASLIPPKEDSVPQKLKKKLQREVKAGVKGAATWAEESAKSTVDGFYKWLEE